MSPKKKVKIDNVDNVPGVPEKNAFPIFDSM